MKNVNGFVLLAMLENTFMVLLEPFGKIKGKKE